MRTCWQKRGRERKERKGHRKSWKERKEESGRRKVKCRKEKRGRRWEVGKGETEAKRKEDRQAEKRGKGRQGKKEKEDRSLSSGNLALQSIENILIRLINQPKKKGLLNAFYIITLWYRESKLFGELYYDLLYLHFKASFEAESSKILN